MIDEKYLLGGLQDSSQQEGFALATIAGVYDDGLTLRFDGETAAAQKHYKRLKSFVNAAEGQRVAVLNIGGSYLVLGEIGAASGSLDDHPVGSLFFTSSWDNRPAVKFGGTWTQIKDKFILGAGDTYANGANGGASAHTLVANEIPPLYTPTYFVGTGNGIKFASSDGNTVVNGNTLTGNGGGQAFSIMPPYIAKYIWERTA